MNAEKIKIHQIPAVIWGENSDHWIIAAHGRCSSKIDDCIWILAEEAVKSGYQVLSFDFPKHGERVYETEPCMVQQCVGELGYMLEFAKEQASHIGVFGCSMGAYFSLLAYQEEPIEQALFLSPVTDMKRIIQNLLAFSRITETEFEEKRIVENPFETLYWDYYSYVKEHPVISWKHPTSILYGEHDDLCEYSYVSGFAEKFGCNLEVHKGGEHWFHTDEELEYFRKWVRRELKAI